MIAGRTVNRQPEKILCVTAHTKTDVLYVKKCTVNYTLCS